MHKARTEKKQEGGRVCRVVRDSDEREKKAQLLAKGKHEKSVSAKLSGRVSGVHKKEERTQTYGIAMPGMVRGAESCRSAPNKLPRPSDRVVQATTKVSDEKI